MKICKSPCHNSSLMPKGKLSYQVSFWTRCRSNMVHGYNVSDIGIPLLWGLSGKSGRVQCPVKWRGSLWASWKCYPLFLTRSHDKCTASFCMGRSQEILPFYPRVTPIKLSVRILVVHDLKMSLRRFIFGLPEGQYSLHYKMSLSFF